MQFHATVVLAYLAAIGVAAPAPANNNAGTQLGAREQAKDHYVNTYYQKSYPTDKEDDVEKREEAKDHYVNTYYQKSYLTDEGNDVEKREQAKDHYVNTYYQKAYPTNGEDEVESTTKDAAKA